MTVREGIKRLAEAVYHHGRKPRTPFGNRQDHLHSRQLPPTDILLSEVATTSVQGLLASLPNRAATCALEDEPGATKLYYRCRIEPINELGNQRFIFTVQNRETLVNSPQSDTIYALYTIDMSKAFPGRKHAFTIEAQYAPNIPQDVSFRPFDFNEDDQQIPPDRSSLFRFHFTNPENPSLNMVTVSYAPGVNDEQPDADTTLLLQYGQHEPALQHVLGQLNALNSVRNKLKIG